MRAHLTSFAALLLAAFSARADNISAYSDLLVEQNCTQFAGAEDGNGDWANFVCDGYRGYPVFLYYSDLRESLFYGHPPGGDLAPAWESFSAFNSTGQKIEWRIAKDNDREIPFATIHRWFVSQGESSAQLEVLVVEKVGQPHGREGCAVAYVMATGNANANEKARRYADELAQDFSCGADEPTIDTGSVPLPEFVRERQ